jgi:cytidylate kinase
MYRAVTLKAVSDRVDLADAEALAAVTRDSEIAFRLDGEVNRVLLGGEDVTKAIRRPELTRKVRELARCAAARAEMVKKQRALADLGPVVMEGRDIQTVVLPDARWKFFLDASLAVRARRRAGDLERAGARGVDLAAVECEMASRDRSDSERDAGPLAAAPDAVVVDTTGLSVKEVVGLLERRVRAGVSPRRTGPHLRAGGE